MNAFSFDSSSGCITVCGEFSVYQAQDAKSGLIEAMKDGNLRSLDLGGVTEFDCSALQLILSLGSAVHVSAMSDRVQAVVSLLNVTLPVPAAEANA